MEVNTEVQHSPSKPIEGNTYLQGVKDCVPTLLGYLSIGFAAGVVERTAGFSLMEIALLSLIVYAGSAQFIAAGMVAAVSPIATIVTTIFFVNARHLLLSAAIAPYFEKLSARKSFFIGSLLTDETFGVASTKAQEQKKLGYKWMVGLNLTAYLNWCAANVAGGLVGDWIPNPERWGLDFALPGMFIGLLALQMISRKKFGLDLLVALCAAAAVVLASFLMPPSAAIIVAILVAATAGMVMERWK
ncbi:MULTISPECIES: AzlC family ABC transporter permease [Paenibacillus]|uniref:Branched-chain amino acid ABC transporter permease n=1 Tax=Paenibacillus campinasensis TaxID=66347 RepID=A0A268EN23_9BACL|nr:MULTISPECIES: AzlC family ABC transporter permease [Paenibacillus]MUG65799.1 branched-chain amino acid ABC transporter permease [Paenibacillus campinasensis]PAD74515.1 branched-chain amino acid ABC transporter permease [Paenibacillus campinasensis]PAK51601.1 branched-chain amino acid ABC transporter permease [Paenibacillus sp. 7541]